MLHFTKLPSACGGLTLLTLPFFACQGEWRRQKMDTRCAHVRWQIRPGALPFLSGTNWAASFSQGTSSDWPEGRSDGCHQRCLLHSFRFLSPTVFETFVHMSDVCRRMKRHAEPEGGAAAHCYPFLVVEEVSPITVFKLLLLKMNIIV